MAFQKKEKNKNSLTPFKCLYVQMEIADRFGSSLSCLSLLCFSARDAKGRTLQAESFSSVSDSAWTQRPHLFRLWLPRATLLENALGSAAGGHADLGKAQTSEVGCESAGFGLRLPQKPVLVLAFSSCVDLASYFNVLSPRFLTCQLVVPTRREVVRMKREDAGKALGLVPGIYETIQNLSKILMLVGAGGWAELGGWARASL